MHGTAKLSFVFQAEKNVYHTRFYPKKKESSAHCSYAARGSSHKIWFSEEEVMLLAFGLCMSDKIIYI